MCPHHSVEVEFVSGVLEVEQGSCERVGGAKVVG